MKLNQTNLMKYLAALVAGFLCSTTFGQETNILATQKDKDSYTIGVDLARNLKRRGVSMQTEMLLRGMRDVLDDQKLLMTDEDLRENLRLVQLAERQKVILAVRGVGSVAEENAAKGEAFLAQNKTNQDVVCLPSGVQYKILKAGSGPKPTETATIECRFRGTLIDGQQFAGTNPDGPTASFPVSGVVPGLKEAIQLMPTGSKWQVVVPAPLAYGEKGAGRSKLGANIGPNSTLIYELELVAVK